jgi:hypothetical protein
MQVSFLRMQVFEYGNSITLLLCMQVFEDGNTIILSSTQQEFQREFQLVIHSKLEDVLGLSLDCPVQVQMRCVDLSSVCVCVCF